ncbi:MAG: TssQ family T6SS-associated lipoprotein [Gallionellaceae bacterium]
MMLIATLAAVLLCACGGLRNALVANGNAEHARRDLQKGVKSYESGDYAKAEKFLKDALKDGLINRDDQLIAHKYLAFINCSSTQEKLCRSEFREAFKIDPAFKLQPEEAGNPIWAPVYLDIKSEFVHSNTNSPP